VHFKCRLPFSSSVQNDTVGAQYYMCESAFTPLHRTSSNTTRHNVGMQQRHGKNYTGRGGGLGAKAGPPPPPYTLIYASHPRSFDVLWFYRLTANFDKAKECVGSHSFAQILCPHITHQRQRIRWLTFMSLCIACCSLKMLIPKRLCFLSENNPPFKFYNYIFRQQPNALKDYIFRMRRLECQK
jgi:hypothetical protein